jgi:hypothetical protein
MNVQHRHSEASRGRDRGGNGARDVMELEVKEHVPLPRQHQINSKRPGDGEQLRSDLKPSDVGRQLVDETRGIPKRWHVECDNEAV